MGVVCATDRSIAEVTWFMRYDRVTEKESNAVDIRYVGRKYEFSFLALGWTHGRFLPFGQRHAPSILFYCASKVSPVRWRWPKCLRGHPQNIRNQLNEKENDCFQCCSDSRLGRNSYRMVCVPFLLLGWITVRDIASAVRNGGDRSLR